MYGVPTATLYFEVRGRARRGQIWSKLSGRSRRLLSLAEVDATRVHDRHDAGLRTVPIERIRGTEGRSNDFDRAFLPLRESSRERWMSIARARDQDKALPPVELIQVGDLYFCRDGHHRISVARAVGQRYIEADVTVWQVSGLLPWERSAATDPADQAKGIARFYGQIRKNIAGLHTHILPSLHGLWVAIRARVAAAHTA